MMDLIDRQAVIDVVTKHYRAFDNDLLELITYELGQLPSIQTEPCEDAVSRQRLLSDLKELTAAWGNYPVMAEQIKGVETAIRYVKTIPSAQSEIIRCRDCKHYYFADNRIPQEQRYVCDLDGDRWKPDDYCSFAERMKGEQE